MADLLNWLEEQSLYPKIYWQDHKGTMEIAGAGAKNETSELPESSERFFGGRAFFPASDKDTIWKDFPRSYFFQPVLQMSQIPISPSLYAPKKNVLVSRKDFPAYGQWESTIHAAFDQQIEKVVLGRRSTFAFEERINPIDIFRVLKARAINCTLFILKLSEDIAFIGATPELLYHRTGRKIVSEAVAGTGGEELLHDEKIAREFGAVKKQINLSLQPLCTSWEWETQDRILQTGSVQHRYNCFTGMLGERVTDQQLLNALHPNAAIAGTPAERVSQFLSRREVFDRGWYAAPIGWISRDETEFAIAIRSALIVGNQMHVFAGAGIIEGSHPADEWHELEQKIAPFKYIL